MNSKSQTKNRNTQRTMNAQEHYNALVTIYQSTTDTIDVSNALNQLRDSSKFYSKLATELNGSTDLLAELSQVRSEVGKVARLIIVDVDKHNNTQCPTIEEHLLSANVTTIASSLESWFCVHSILKKKDSNKLFLQIANVYQNLIMAFIENASFDHVHSILETALNQDWQLLQNLFVSSAAINKCSSLDPEHAELYDRVQKRYKHKKTKTTKEIELQQEQKPEQKTTTNHQTSKPQIEQEQSAATTKLAVKALTRSLDVWKRIKPPNKKNMSTMAPNTKSSDIYLYHVDVTTLLKDVLSDDGLSLLCDDIGPSVAAKIVGSGSHLSRAFDTLLHITSVTMTRMEDATSMQIVQDKIFNIATLSKQTLSSKNREKLLKELEIYTSIDIRILARVNSIANMLRSSALSRASTEENHIMLNKLLKKINEAEEVLKEIQKNNTDMNQLHTLCSSIALLGNIMETDFMRRVGGTEWEREHMVNIAQSIQQFLSIVMPDNKNEKKTTTTPSTTSISSATENEQKKNTTPTASVASKGVTIELLHTDGTTVSIPSAQLHHQNGTFHINAKKETKLKTTFTSGAAIQHMTLGKGTFVEGRESLNEAVVVLECDTLKRNVVVSMSQIEDVAKATNKDLSENKEEKEKDELDGTISWYNKYRSKPYMSIWDILEGTTSLCEALELIMDTVDTLEHESELSIEYQKIYQNIKTFMKNKCQQYISSNNSSSNKNSNKKQYDPNDVFISTCFVHEKLIAHPTPLRHGMQDTHTRIKLFKKWDKTTRKMYNNHVPNAKEMKNKDGKIQNSEMESVCNSVHGKHL